jgi:drug/metabolite transporter (DMT)-like permease
MQSGETRKKGLLIVSAGVLLISFDALLIRLSAASNWDVIFWRGLFMFVSLSAILGLRDRTGPIKALRQSGLPGVFSAVFFGLGGLLFVSSIVFTKVANTVVIISLSPLFAALFTWLFRIEIILLRTWLAIAAAFFGVVLVFWGSLGSGGLLGDLIAVAAAVNIGGNLTLLRRYPGLDRLPMVCVGGLIMAGLAVSLAEPFSLSLQSYAVLAVMGLVQMPAALVLIGQSTNYLPSPEVSLFLLVETICSPIWVWLVLGEDPPGMTFVGGTIIIATLTAYFLQSLRERPHPAA